MFPAILQKISASLLQNNILCSHDLLFLLCLTQSGMNREKPVVAGLVKEKGKNESVNLVLKVKAFRFLLKYSSIFQK